MTDPRQGEFWNEETIAGLDTRNEQTDLKASIRRLIEVLDEQSAECRELAHWALTVLRRNRRLEKQLRAKL